ncbi:MAG: hypothetical protein HYZ72_18550 [Deltaproteobacteria bacterium]|nr:hypothetical protein [Deltaproteobacteria bacterium]
MSIGPTEDGHFKEKKLGKSDTAFKVWACINPTCGFTIRIDKGAVVYGVKVGEHKRRVDDH